LHEASEALAPLGVEVVGSDLRPVEIQADSLHEVSRAKCEVLVGRLDPPFMVDDGGLFVPALRDFPGVYSAHALKTIGVPGILRLMEGVEDRRARFEAVVSYHDGRGVRSFHGRCDGTLTTAPRAAGHGFGFDPIFVPEGQDRTFAELPASYKNRFSHRGRALAALAAALHP
ncbi:MAG TPA: non-canonical purine NTP pyrophosphatase, partial [Candidatus Thermoplasmatota archaeon]|nr:non-canonical purine NTP pyrophosphatase [Candidatus Thermoplasmatota archaeon]